MSSKNTPQVELTPVISAFDFREGAFFVVQRTRKSMAMVAGAAALALVLALGAGFLAILSARSSAQAQTLAQTQQITAAAELSKVDNAGGNSAGVLDAHVKRRAAAASAAVGHEVDVVTLIARIRTSTPPGVVLTQVTFKEAPTAPVTSAAGKAAAPAAAGAATVEIHGTAKTFSAIGPWSAALQQVPGLSGVQPTWAGGEPVVQVTLTATLNEAALTKRAGTLTGPNNGGR